MSPVAYGAIVLMLIMHGTPLRGQVADPVGKQAPTAKVQVMASPPPYTPVSPPPAPGTVGAYLQVWDNAYTAMGHAEYRGVQRLDAAVAAGRTAADAPAIIAAMDDLLANRLDRRRKIGELRNGWRTHDFPAEPDKDAVRRHLDNKASSYVDLINQDVWGVEAAIRRAVTRLRALQGMR